jgi:hypothetical protein
MALLMRAELAVAGQQFLSREQHNQLFTMQTRCPAGFLTLTGRDTGVV